LRRAAQPQVPEDQTVGGQVADWLVTLQNRVKLELLSADRLDNYGRLFRCSGRLVLGGSP